MKIGPPNAHSLPLRQRPQASGKRKVKEVPAYIPEPDAQILVQSHTMAHNLDCLFHFFGIRLGWSSIVGLIPAAGDFLDLLLACWLIRSMKKINGGLPRRVTFWMVINVLVDFLAGLVPIVGDLADAAIKCNIKNVRLLEEHLDMKYRPNETV